MISQLKERARLLLWRLALKHCQPAAVSYECPRLVYMHKEKVWQFVCVGNTVALVFGEGDEAVSLDSFLMDAMHFINENPGVVRMETFEGLRGFVKSTLRDGV